MAEETVQRLAGTVKKNRQTCAFIGVDGFEQHGKDADVFVLPTGCQLFGGQIPPDGTRVTFELTLDPQKQKPLAINVAPHGDASAFGALDAMGGMAAAFAQPQVDMSAAAMGSNNLDPNNLMGTMVRVREKCGFVRVDGFEDQGAEADVFCLPSSCAAFGGQIPPNGFRVNFGLTLDPQKQQPFAINIKPAAGQAGAGLGLSAGLGMGASLAASLSTQIGCGGKGKGKRKGFNEGSKMGTAFQLGQQMGQMFAGGGGGGYGAKGGFGGLHAAGKGGGGMAAMGGAAGSDLLHGMITKNAQKHGFIRVDGFEDQGRDADVFCLPRGCAAFGSIIPPEGTRVAFELTLDPQKNRPLAINVSPEGGDAAGGAMFEQLQQMMAAQMGGAAPY